MLELLLGLVVLVIPLMTLVAVFMYGGLAFVLIARAAIIGVVTRARPKQFWPEGGLALMLRSPLRALMNPDLQTDRDTGPGGTELFERPDVGSRVLCTVPKDALVTYCNTEGDFLCVETADRLVGYVPTSACVPETFASTQCHAILESRPI